MAPGVRTLAITATTPICDPEGDPESVSLSYILSA